MLHCSVGSDLSIASIARVLSTAGGLSISFYGAPAGFPLDGGRIVDDTRESFSAAVSYLKAQKVPFTLCCNTVLDRAEVDLSEALWGVVDEAYAPGNSVVVARHWLAEKIRTRYPDFRFIFSSIGAISEQWDVDRLFSDYDVVVCPMLSVGDFRLLSSHDYWAKLEVFMNSECVGFGRNCLAHYRHNSYYNAGKQIGREFQCTNLCKAEMSAIRVQPSRCDVEKYVELGVRRFKVIERTAISQDHSAILHLLRSIQVGNVNVAMQHEPIRSAR